jgi:Flp pilus assembly protein TadB
MLKQHKEMYGSDDWLAREIRRESRISAWDMDGGKIVREEHEENCDAQRLRAEHALDCEAQEVAQEHRAEHLSRQTEPAFSHTAGSAKEQQSGDRVTPDKKKMLAIVMGLFIITVAIPYLAFLILPAGIVLLMIAAKKKNR